MDTPTRPTLADMINSLDFRMASDNELIRLLHSRWSPRVRAAIEREAKERGIYG